MGGRGAVLPAACLWAGLAAGIELGGAVPALALSALGFAALAWRAPDRTGTIALLVAMALSGGARGAGHRLALEAERGSLAGGEGLWRIAGRVLEPPLRESGEPVAVVAIDAADPPLPRGMRIRLRLPAGSGAEWGDRLVALARLEIPLARRNPGGFDARASAGALGLAGSGRAFWAQARPGRGFDAWPRAGFARWRRAVEGRLARGVDSRTRELVVPLLLGDRTNLSTDLQSALKASGLVHLLALSGLHVAWMAAIVRAGLATLGGGVRARALGGALCAILYVGIAGPLPSLARAAAAEGMVSLARLAGRALDPLQALALAAILLLVACPGWSVDLGFQLSCAATLGLVTLGPALDRSLPPGFGWARALSPTVGAQVLALPLLLARLHSFSWIGLATNLAAVPIAGLLLAAAWLGVAVDLAAPGLGHACFASCEALGQALRAVAELGAGVPGAVLAAGRDPVLPVLAALAALLLSSAVSPPRDLVTRSRPLSRARTAAWALGAIAMALAIVQALTVRPLRPAPGCFWLVALDVGQGDALALGFEDGWWLVDAGPRSPHFDAGESVVAPFLRWTGVRRLEALVLTHDDGDHTGGAAAVTRAVTVGRVVVAPPFPRVPGPGRRGRAHAVARGELLRARPEMRVRWPPRPREVRPGDPEIASDNRAALVLEVGENRGRVLLLADVDSTVESALAVAPRVALLKVAHHGSGSSSGAGFLNAARPTVALVTCGRRNPFGHPHPGALARLRRSGARIERTDAEGALWFELDSTGARPLEWRRGGIGARRVIASPAPGAAAAPRRP